MWCYMQHCTQCICKLRAMCDVIFNFLHCVFCRLRQSLKLVIDMHSFLSRQYFHFPFFLCFPFSTHLSLRMSSSQMNWDKWKGLTVFFFFLNPQNIWTYVVWLLVAFVVFVCFLLVAFLFVRVFLLFLFVCLLVFSSLAFIQKNRNVKFYTQTSDPNENHPV